MAESYKILEIFFISPYKERFSSRPKLINDPRIVDGCKMRDITNLISIKVQFYVLI